MTIYKLYWIKDSTCTDPYSEGYIGITKRSIKQRLSEHLERKKDLPEGVTIQLLHKGSVDEISALEAQYRPESWIGWNRAPGGLTGGRPTGIHTAGWTHSDEAKKARSERAVGEGNPMFGKPTSDKQKEAASVANSVPKPYVAENMKKRHAEGKTYAFSEEDSIKAGKAAQAKKPKWFTNGKENKYCSVGEEPRGFWRGRTTGWKTHP